MQTRKFGLVFRVLDCDMGSISGLCDLEQISYGQDVKSTQCWTNSAHIGVIGLIKNHF